MHRRVSISPSSTPTSPANAGYYESALRLVRPGGLILLDNMLWGGAVIDDDDDRRSTRTLRALNAQIQADDRVDMSLLPVGDGLTLCRVRE